MCIKPLYSVSLHSKSIKISFLDGLHFAFSNAMLLLQYMLVEAVRKQNFKSKLDCANWLFIYHKKYSV